MSNENFFKHDDKAYAENLNDAILIANAFDYQVPVNIPGMYGNNHYPNDNNIHKVGVADVTIVSSGSLSIGDTSITNNSNTSQVLRLKVYPNFNNFYGWKDLGWDGDDGITIDICDAGTTTSLLPSGELTNPDGNNLAGIASLRGLKEYDLLITIPTNCSLNSLSLVFVNNLNSQNRVSASINQSNVTGLVSDLSGIRDDLSSLESGKADTEHSHTTSVVVERNALSNIGTSANATQAVVNGAVDESVGSLSTSITNKVDTVYTQTLALSTGVWTGGNNLYLYRVGKLVVAFINSGQLKYTSTGWKDMITLPEGYRPRINTPLGIINNSSEAFNQWRTNNNVLQVYCATANSSVYTGCFGVWVTNDDYPSP